MNYGETIKVQIVDGGKKYASSNAKMETTDILTERYGFGGLMWTINKYYFRFENLGLEKDLQKIGAYMFITWLKWGKHLGDLTRYNKFRMVNTNLELKNKYIDVFLAKAAEYKKTERSKDSRKFESKAGRLELIDSCISVVWENFKRANFDECYIFDVFLACEDMFQELGFSGEDTDSKKLSEGIGKVNANK